MDTFVTGHIGLNITSLARSKKFYQDVFGFEAIAESNEEGKRFAFLGTGGNIVLTLWEQGQGRFDRQPAGLHHLSFAVESIERVREIEQRLKKGNVPLLYPGVVAHSEGATSGGVFFEDPDGIRLEVFTAEGAAGYPAPAGNAPSCGFF